MRVLHLSHCANLGGAARAAYRLHRSLLAANVDSVMWLGNKDVDDPTVFPLPHSILLKLAALPAKVERKLERMKIPAGVSFSPDRVEMSRSQLAGIEAFDVVHLHFLAHAFDLPNLFDMLNKRQKLVWTLHDANPFTGGCHIFGNCERYVGACGCCPVLQSSQESDLSRKVHLRKTKLYSDRDLTFIGPSRWISSSCSQSSLGKPFKHVVIPHAIDADLFVPTDRAVAKTRLNVPSDRFVVGWLAASVNDPNKGLDLLISALAKLDTKKIHLLWAGAHDREMDVPYSHTKLPAMSEHSRLLDFYAASDVFAMTSRSETYGLAAAEANACGTPVVGFNCTGLPDAVAVGKLVEAFDTTNLGLAIESYAGLPCEQYEATRTEARNEAIRVNSMVDWANRHLAIYQSHA